MLDSPDGVQTIIDPRDAAESAGLRHISDARPGIRRKKAGTGFTYERRLAYLKKMEEQMKAQHAEEMRRYGWDHLITD